MGMVGRGGEWRGRYLKSLKLYFSSEVCLFSYPIYFLHVVCLLSVPVDLLLLREGVFFSKAAGDPKGQKSGNDLRGVYSAGGKWRREVAMVDEVEGIRGEWMIWIVSKEDGGGREGSVGIRGL